MSERYEIAIVGGGPAGLAAGVEAASRKVSHVVLERAELANTIFKYQKGKHVMAEPEKLPLHEELPLAFAAGSREEILGNWSSGVEAVGVNLLRGPQYELTAIEGTKGDFTLRLKDGQTLSAAHVVLCIGLQGNLRTFGVPGDDLPFVTYQLDDPAAFVDKRVMVVGVGDAGIENAMALMEHDNELIIINRAAEIDRAKTANKVAIEGAIKAGRMAYYINTMVDHFEEGVAVLNTPNGQERVEVDLVIGRLGAIPPRKFMEATGITFSSQDREAVPEVSETYESNVPGLYLVGAIAGYPLIKHCMNQGFEVVEYILGNPVTPADEPILRETFKQLPGSVNEVLERIRSTIPLFRGLTIIQLREFLADSKVHHPKPGEVIFERNQFSDTFYTILEGEVDAIVPASDEDAAADGLELERLKRERSHRAIRLGPGQFFGEGSLLSGRRRSATVKAASACVLIETPRLATNKLIKSVPEVRRVMDQTFIARQIENMLPEMPKEELARLSQDAEILTFGQGKTLFEEGDEPDGLHLIRRGSVSVSQTRAGREVVIGYVPAGNYVGEMALLGPDRKRGARVRAAVYTETVRLPTSSFVPVLERYPEVRRKIEKIEDERNTQLLTAREEGATDLISFLLNAGAGEATDLLLIDESLCVRCDNCEKACADTHNGVTRLDREAGPTFGTIHVPTACRHCENPKCMTDCPPDAIRRNPNGEVYIMDNCIGCGNCAAYCPYDVIQMAAVDPGRRPSLLTRLLFGRQTDPRYVPPELANDNASKHAVKCDLCVSLPQLRRKDPPTSACVSSCPTGAIVRVKPGSYVEELQGGEV